MPRRLEITPLELRSSFRRIRKCSERRKLLWQLLYPRPWRFQAKPLPPTHDVLTAKAKAAGPEGEVVSASRLQRNIRQLQFLPLFRVRDTPLCSLCDFYEDLCSGSIIPMGYESEYFFHHDEASWRLSQIADPEDADIVRYAVLASFVEVLVASFNWKIELGLRRNGTIASEPGQNDDYQLFLETPPSWTSRVKPLAETVDLLPPDSGDRINAPLTTGFLGGTALGSKDMIDHPENAFMDIIGIVTDAAFLRTGKGYEDAAAARRGMDGALIEKSGKTIKQLDDKMQDFLGKTCSK